MSLWLVVRAPIDRVLALVLLVAVLPVVAACAAVKRLEDGGRAFVRVPRVGRDGHPLRVVKLRSMVEHGPDGLATGGSLAAGDDDRITSVGRFLRRWRLDELPQLAQVVGGSMALVGPRPEAAAYVDATDPSWRAVLRARPGIAGPTQLLVEHLEASLGAAHADAAYRAHLLPLKLRIDRWYVENATPLTDAFVVTGVVERFVLRRRPRLLAQYVTSVNPGLDDELAAVEKVLLR